MKCPLEHCVNLTWYVGELLFTGLVINNRYCSLTIHNKNEAALAAVFIRSWGKNVKVHFEGEKELIGNLSLD